MCAAALGGELQDLQKANLHWQKAFNAQDFKVVLQIVPMAELRTLIVKDDPTYITPDTIIFGASTWDTGSMTGLIYVCDGASYTPEVLKYAGITKRQIRQDQENTIAHEYTHLIWDKMASEERAVTMIADLITRIHRKVESK